MAFKFSLLSLEKTNECEDVKTETMAKKKTDKQKAHQKKFGKAVQKCHKETTGKKSFGKCMKRELKK